MNNIKLITFMQKRNENIVRHELSFRNMSELKKYVKSCGGIKSFKWNEEDSKCNYVIMATYKGAECYYEHKYGKYMWVDCNSYEIKRGDK